MPLHEKSFLTRDLKILMVFLAGCFLFAGCNEDVKGEEVVISISQVDEEVIDNSFQDSFSSPGSSWIKGADYSSDDGDVGMMNIYTDSKKYSFRDVPVSVWNNFKNAPSKGSYYHSYIKDRYPL